MASKYRCLIATRLRQALHQQNWEESQVPSVRSLISKMTLSRPTSGSRPSFLIQIPDSIVQRDSNPDSKSLSQMVEDFETDRHLPEIVLSDQSDSGEKTGRRVPTGQLLNFRLPAPKFIHDVLKVALKGRATDLRRNGLFPKEEIQRVIVEFSSPNVAKPFHMGHLRSTILGHFCANIYEAVGHDVTRLNWLGDWGTQFGFIAAGLKDSNGDLKANRDLHALYKIYVDANAKGQDDPAFATLARDCFRALEQGDPEMLEQWSLIRHTTIEVLEQVYQRLGVHFHAYHGESMYRNDKNGDILQLLNQRGLLVPKDGKQVINTKIGKKQIEKEVTIVKSDGSSLYITRDIAAAIHRANQYKFDRMLYVVENGQTDHFLQLFAILKQLNFDSRHQMEHVKFGRISKMSSRKGTAVFLSDILDEAKDRVKEQRELSATTRVVDNTEELLDTLGTTAVIINDFRAKRLENYEFSWKKALKTTGNSGIRLQYFHCRLFSLIGKQGHSMTTLLEILENNPEIGRDLVEDEALALIERIAIFDESVRNAYVHLEPSILVKYLFALCSDISKAIMVLSVKDAKTEEIRLTRLALFAGAKMVLKEGLELLGIRVLDQM